MPRFIVNVNIREVWRIEVDAEDEYAAEALALEKDHTLGEKVYSDNYVDTVVEDPV